MQCEDLYELISCLLPEVTASPAQNCTYPIFDNHLQEVRLLFLPFWKNPSREGMQSCGESGWLGWFFAGVGGGWGGGGGRRSFCIEGGREIEGIALWNERYLDMTLNTHSHTFAAKHRLRYYLCMKRTHINYAILLQTTSILIPAQAIYTSVHTSIHIHIQIP